MPFSTKVKTMIPKGVATLLPEGTYRRRFIEREILSSFDRWAYREVIPPIFEYFDVVSRGVGVERLDSAYKFIDRATGRIMVLRPDVTPQIARIAATLLDDQPKPLRLCYSANVFRHEEEHAGREREIFQIGGELIGPSDAEADAEMIALTIEILLRLGLKSFRITMGQMAFTHGILSPFADLPDFSKKILHCVSKKEASELERLLKEAQVDAKTQQQVLALIDLLGGEEVFDTAATLSDHPNCVSGLERLREVYAILKAAGYEKYLLIDLGEVRGFDYYTGTIFEVLCDGVGSELGGGGRYDNLLARFGAPSPSTGFALSIEQIQSALEYANPPENEACRIDFLLLHTQSEMAKAMALSAQLREAGFRVIRKKVADIEKLNDFDTYREEARKQRINKILIVPDENSKNPLQELDPENGEIRHQDREDLLDWLRAGMPST